MATVYVWLPVSNDLYDTGHGSILVGGKYYSYYPNGECDVQKGQKVKKILPTAIDLLARPSNPSTFASPYEDAEHMERKWSEKIELHNLNEKRMLALWEEADLEDYNLILSNCCTVVSLAILFGLPISNNVAGSTKAISYFLKQSCLDSVQAQLELIIRGISRRRIPSETLRNLIPYTPSKLLKFSHYVRDIVG